MAKIGSLSEAKNRIELFKAIYTTAGFKQKDLVPILGYNSTSALNNAIVREAVLTDAKIEKLKVAIIDKFPSLGDAIKALYSEESFESHKRKLAIGNVINGSASTIFGALEHILITDKEITSGGYHRIIQECQKAHKAIPSDILETTIKDLDLGHEKAVALRGLNETYRVTLTNLREGAISWTQFARKEELPQTTRLR